MSSEIATPSQQAKSQATAIEQSRAVAEVQAAVVVAQQVPRNIRRAVTEMNDVCVNATFADRAAYAVPNRGSGPSVHLARELARLWGNVQYGVHELHRDDIEGVSEIVAFAWDVQANTRSSRTFIVPHAKSLKTGGRKKLVDLNDVYLNNQNIGARAVRECIFTVLPDWFIHDAQKLCEQTRRKGEGVPLRKRIDTIIAAFREMKVTDSMLEERLGKPAAQWDEADVADLKVLGRSLKDGEASMVEEFEPRHKPVTATELVGSIAASPDAPPREVVDPWTGEMVTTTNTAATEGNKS